MDDTPKNFVEELRSNLFRRRVGQIAVAVVLAEACLRFLNGLVWYAVIPTLANFFDGHSESVLFKTRRQFPADQLAGSIIEFIGPLIFVFYLNRWVEGKKAGPTTNFEQPIAEPVAAPSVNASPIRGEPDLYNMVGERVTRDE